MRTDPTNRDGCSVAPLFAKPAMTQKMLKTPHGSLWRSACRPLRAITLAGGWGLTGLAYPAEPAQSPPPVETAATVTDARAAPAHPDVLLARAALLALDSEPELRGVNLIVSVVDRVALIGGAVGNSRQSLRAEQVVRAVPGILDVRNTCFVSVGPDPLLKAVTERVGPEPPPRPVMPHLPGVLTHIPQPPAPRAARSSAPQAESSTVGKPAEVVVVRRPPVTGEGFLGAPVGAARGPDRSVFDPGEVTPADKIRPSRLPDAELMATVRRTKDREVRFANLTVEFQDGVLWIEGTAPLAADAWDLAQRLQAIPGVNRVVVGSVSGK